MWVARTELTHYAARRQLQLQKKSGVYTPHNECKQSPYNR